MDRFTKEYVIYLSNQNFNGEIYISEYLNIFLIWNDGIAFGLFSDNNQILYNIISSIILFIITVLFYLMIKAKRFKKYIYIIIIGGALGNLFDRFYYSILCSVIGDIIGYGNSKIEFNRGYNKQINTRKDVRRMAGVSNYHVVNFIKDGGLSGFNPKKFIVSDDTILMLSVLLALTKSYNKL